MASTTPPATGPRLKLDPAAFLKRFPILEHPEFYKVDIDLQAVREAYEVRELQAMDLTVSTP